MTMSCGHPKAARAIVAAPRSTLLKDEPGPKYQLITICWACKVEAEIAIANLEKEKP